WPDTTLPSLQTGALAELLLVLLGLKVPGAASCPTDCVCYPSPMTVSCQAHNFVTIPEGIPEDSERIFLQNNQITLLLRGHFSPSMVTLWIYSNNITFIDPNTFEGFVNLEELDLGDNRYLRALAANTFQGLVKLHALYLYKCGLSSLPSGIFGGLHNLQYLYLQDNHIESLRVADCGGRADGKVLAHIAANSRALHHETKPTLPNRIVGTAGDDGRTKWKIANSR
uniref:Reticulon 4 receptor like 1 n=1 Tax=Meleagris gallopavo TaxID=9103 RepID=A0A803XW16_MELGA